MIQRVVYVSRLREESSAGNLVEMVGRSVENNTRLGLTGMLCYARRHFLQALEGEAEALNRTFEKIVQDKRHERVRLVSFADVGRRHFESWRMGFAHVDDAILFADFPDLLALARRSPYAPFPLDPDAALMTLQLAARRGLQHASTSEPPAPGATIPAGTQPD